MNYKIWIGIGLVALYLFRLIQFPTDDPVLASFVDSNNEKRTYGLLVSEEPNIKNGFANIRGKLLFDCTVGESVTCDQNKRSDYFVQTRLYAASFQEKINTPRGEIEPGNIVYINGVLGSTMITSDNPEAIDYQRYLKKEKIFYELKSPKFIGMTESGAYTIKRKLVRIRKSIEKQIADNLPRPESDLAQGLIISGKGSMSPELLEHFKRVGLIHIVVLSGSNVSIISAALFAMLARLPYVTKTAIGILGMTCFAIMTGAAPPVVRSVLMSSIPLMFGLFSKKENANDISGPRLFPEQSSSVILLFLTATLMSIHNPLLPIYDISFQLSFMATLGLMTLTSPISKLLTFLPEKFSVREIVSASIGTQILVAPLLLHIGGSLSTVFLVANIIVLPLLPLIMFLIFSVSVVGFMNKEIAQLIGGVSHLLLHLIIRGVELLSAFKFAVIEMGELSRKTVGWIYLFLAPISMIISNWHPKISKPLHTKINPEGG